MYNGSYYSDKEELKIPQNYDGNAFVTEPRAPTTNEIPATASAETKISRGDNIFVDFPKGEDISEAHAESDEVQPTSQKFSLGGLFQGGLGNLLNFSSMSFGTEEILILALAAFLFFSKNGDKECALILLFLLFVH